MVRSAAMAAVGRNFRHDRLDRRKSWTRGGTTTVSIQTLSSSCSIVRCWTTSSVGTASRCPSRSGGTTARSACSSTARRLRRARALLTISAPPGWASSSARGHGGCSRATKRPLLMDGGAFRIPEFGTFGPYGKWLPGGRGVEPDVTVEEEPASFAKGREVQFLAAVRHLQAGLKTHPVQAASRPKPLRR
jgi:hypothetical protein